MQVKQIFLKWFMGYRKGRPGLRYQPVDLFPERRRGEQALKEGVAELLEGDAQLREEKDAELQEKNDGREPGSTIF